MNQHGFDIPSSIPNLIRESHGFSCATSSAFEPTAVFRHAVPQADKKVVLVRV